MRRKILFIALTIALAAALVGGGTLAWFTAKAQVTNEFTAGTVMIEAGEEIVYSADLSMDNVNPGDAFKKCIPIENTGSKNIRLSMAAEFVWDIDWDIVEDNWDELCFTLQEWEDVGALKEAVEEALASGNVTNPAEAAGEPNGPFDASGRLVIPIMVTPEQYSDWVMKKVDGELVFFYDSILAPGQKTNLCVIVVFDGPWMGNLWQGVTLTMEAKFQAIQSSNNAPQVLWGAATWENYQSLISLTTIRDRLVYEFGSTYADYFFDDEGVFIYGYLCEMREQNGNGDCWWETAYGGDSEGDSSAWWFYFDTSGDPTQTLWAGQHYDAGSVTVTIVQNNGYVNIAIQFADGWALDENADEPVKIKGYFYEDLPEERPASGQLDHYKGDSLNVTFNVPPYKFYDLYVIHLDVQYCE